MVGKFMIFYIDILVHDYIISQMNLPKNIVLLFQKFWNHATENNNSKEFNMFRSTSPNYATLYLKKKNYSSQPIILNPNLILQFLALKTCKKRCAKTCTTILDTSKMY